MSEPIVTEIPELIKSKNLQSKIPDYILSSQHLKKLALKTYIERMRLSKKICGFELLQLSDCLKYENKNGLIDFFDNDKYIEANWMRQFNDDMVLLADIPEKNFLTDEPIIASVHLSNYSWREPQEYELSLQLTLS